MSVRGRRRVAPAYGLKRYWEARYVRRRGHDTRGEADEWLLDWEQLRGLLPRIRSASVLDLGCGASAFLRDLREQGGARGRLVGIDYAASAVSLCRRERAARGVAYLQMDTRSMTFRSRSFDVVLDKATLDGQLCGRGSAAATCREVGRVLRPGGTYVLVTWRGPGRVGGLSWLGKVVLPALREGAGSEAWRVVVHSFAEARRSQRTARSCRGYGQLPNVFVITKLKRTARGAAAEIPITHHVH